MHKYKVQFHIFRTFSSSGPDPSRGLTSYQFVYKTNFGSYAFNAIDLSPIPGPKRPFNFFGHVDEVRHLVHNVSFLSLILIQLSGLSVCLVRPFLI